MLTRRLIAHAGAAAALAVAIPLQVQAQSDTDTQSAMPLAGVTLPAETLRESRFRFLDLNGDEYLTREEIDEDDPVLSSQFRSLDRNNDGRLSKVEYVSIGKLEPSTAQ